MGGGSTDPRAELKPGAAQVAPSAPARSCARSFVPDYMLLNRHGLCSLALVVPSSE